MCNSSHHPKAEYPSSSLPHTPGSLSDRCYSDNVLLHTERKVSSTCCCAARHRTPCMLLRRLHSTSSSQTQRCTLDTQTSMPACTSQQHTECSLFPHSRSACRSQNLPDIRRTASALCSAAHGPVGMPRTETPHYSGRRLQPRQHHRLPVPHCTAYTRSNPLPHMCQPSSRRMPHWRRC